MTADKILARLFPGIQEYVAAHQSHSVVDRIPVLRGMTASGGRLESLAEGNPACADPASL